VRLNRIELHMSQQVPVGNGRPAPANVISGSRPLVLPMEGEFGADCPCGFTFTTPHGQEDAVAVVKLHLRRVHGKANATRDEALAAIKAR